MESLMQYVWQHRLWPQRYMHTVDGRRVVVIDPGMLNRDSGPDFFNAKVEIDNRLWVGNVEIHVKASDWYRHHHDTDKAYDSVILHVVDRDDTRVTRHNGEEIPQLVMECEPGFYNHYRGLVERADRDLPCVTQLREYEPVKLTGWITSLAYERLYEKSDRILALTEKFTNDWDSAAYITVARCLGFSTNSDPFERLALSTPLNFLSKHADSLFSLEAILFGQSGLLDDAPEADAYVESLKREYAFMAHKFGLKKPESLGWKMARMRPPNFPHRRIAALAAIIHGGYRLLSTLINVESVKEACEVFLPRLSPYWQNHYTFNAPSPPAPAALSLTSCRSMAINAVVPLIHAYATAHDLPEMCQKAIDILQELPGERNSVIEPFERAGVKIKDAFTSQALLQLRRRYCMERKCLYCRIGHGMLSAKVRRAAVNV